MDVIETAFIRRLQQASAPLGQSALPQPLIVYEVFTLNPHKLTRSREGLDMVRRFATRESAFLMGTAKSVLSGDSISFELPLLSDTSRTVLVQQPWESAVEGPEGIVLYTTEKLSRRSAELTQRGTWMSVALQHCKPDSGPFVEWRSIAKGTVQKAKVSGKAALAAEAGIVQVPSASALPPLTRAGRRRHCIRPVRSTPHQDQLWLVPVSRHLPECVPCKAQSVVKTC